MNNIKTTKQKKQPLLEILCSNKDDNFFIRQAYEEILGRPADIDGLNYYKNELEINSNRLAIIYRLRSSKESKERKISMPEIDKKIKNQNFLQSSIVRTIVEIFSPKTRNKVILQKLLVVNDNINSYTEETQRNLQEMATAIRKLDDFIANNIATSNAKKYEQIVSFEPNWYVEKYPDVQASGINPYEHFIRFGLTEGRGSSDVKQFKPNPQISKKINCEPGTKVHDVTVLEKNSDLRIKELVKLICFYLPQYHAIPENDAWWGKGFTEWTNVKPAKPQFKDHYQPRLPNELGYYDLLDKTTQHRQVELAKNYGIEGFCFYYYWFGGSRLLEKPVENYLKDTSLDLPFCLCWANENWSRRWDGLESEILIAQKHSPEDDIAFIESVIEYMRDSRYIKIDGRPLLLVYRPSLLPSAKETVERWRKHCRKVGIGEIYLAYTQSFEKSDPRSYGFDAAIEFPPNNSNITNVTKEVQPLSNDFSCAVYDWTALVDRSYNYETPDYTIFRGVCPSWDNTARRKNNSSILVNSSPHKYQEWLCNAIADTTKRISNPDERFVFINAWNEWAEGAYLEPDERYGFAYLEATRMALLRSAIQKTSSNKIQLIETKPAKTVALIIHAFYTDVLEEIVKYLKVTGIIKLKLYVTCPPDIKDKVQIILKKQNHKYHILVTENIGRDVLPFLKLMPLVIKEKHDFVVKIHTKKSKHREDGERWRNELFSQLIGKEALNGLAKFFDSNPNAGILGPTGHVVPMNYYFGSNSARVEALAHRMGMGVEALQTLNFVAGTMFAARVTALIPLLSLGLKDSDFESESGQVDGTLAHAIERALSVSAWAAKTEVVTLTQNINTNYDFAAKTIVT